MHAALVLAGVTLEIEDTRKNRGETPFIFLAPWKADLTQSAHDPDEQDCLSSGGPARRVHRLQAGCLTTRR
jgi:hypothetical protein